MTSVQRRMASPPAVVFDALIDPATYPGWLVGCKAIRDIDADWPAPGSRFHHRVGIFAPIEVEDHSVSLAVVESQELVLEVRARPVGRGRAEFRLEPDGEGTIVHLSEVPIGLARVVGPLVAPLTVARNRRSLDQLAAVLDR